MPCTGLIRSAPVNDLLRFVFSSASRGFSPSPPASDPGDFPVPEITSLGDWAPDGPVWPRACPESLLGQESVWEYLSSHPQGNLGSVPSCYKPAIRRFLKCCITRCRGDSVPSRHAVQSLSRRSHALDRRQQVVCLTDLNRVCVSVGASHGPGTGR